MTSGTACRSQAAQPLAPLPNHNARPWSTGSHRLIVVLVSVVARESLRRSLAFGRPWRFMPRSGRGTAPISGQRSSCGACEDTRRCSQTHRSHIALESASTFVERGLDRSRTFENFHNPNLRLEWPNRFVDHSCWRAKDSSSHPVPTRVNVREFANGEISPPDNRCEGRRFSALPRDRKLPHRAIGLPPQSNSAPHACDSTSERCSTTC
jgi:hypothetical protein